MSTSGRKRPRLVADKRHPKPKKKPAAAKKKPVTQRKKSPPKRKKRTSAKRKRNPVFAFIIRVLSGFLRLVWKITWRVSVVGAAL
jgi:hypothetical protein